MSKIENVFELISIKDIVGYIPWMASDVTEVFPEVVIAGWAFSWKLHSIITGIQILSNLPVYIIL